MNFPFSKLILSLSIFSFILTLSCANSNANQPNISQPESTIKEQSLKISDHKSPNSQSLVFYTDKGIAIRGTDTVAYFQEGKPVKGNAKFSYKWGNAIWYFKSAENRDLFASNPEKYAPQYGGFCAWAASQNYTAPTDPTAWKIVNGKLYLNYNHEVKATWEKDIPGNIAKANQNWPSLLDGLRSKDK